MTLTFTDEELEHYFKLEVTEDKYLQLYKKAKEHRKEYLNMCIRLKRIKECGDENNVL